jgi:hypothetical protein
MRAQATLADVLVATGRRVDSHRAQQRTLALARRLGDRFELAVAASNFAVYALLVGDASGAFGASRQALRAFEAMGVEHVNRRMCASVHTIAAAHHGRFDLALATAEPLLAREDDPDPLLRNLRNVLATVWLWLARPERAEPLLPPRDDPSPPSVRVTGLFTRLRWCAATGSDDRADREALCRLGEALPALREDPHFYRSWAAYDPADEALTRLDAAFERELQAGAAGLAAGLGVAALQIALREDRPDIGARALRVAPLVEHGLHPAQLPTEAWCCLALGLARAASMEALAQRALERGRGWMADAHLPAGDADRQAWRNRLIAQQPMLAALASAPVPG